MRDSPLVGDRKKIPPAYFIGKNPIRKNLPGFRLSADKNSLTFYALKK